MKKISLKKLVLKDFQGGNFTLESNGQDVHISGDNGVGKTRLISAFTWLLFNKDSLGRNDFQIKNLDATGEAAHGLEHTVEAVLDVNGDLVTLKKVYVERWTKQRGRAHAEFSGHTTNHFIDEIPVSEKDYKARIAEITGDEARFRLLTSPTTFPALHWKEMRSILLSVCGDISDQDVINSDEKLFALTAILGKRKLDDHKKVVAARKAEINGELGKIPVRIDEVRRSLPDIAGLDKDALWNEQLRLEGAISDAKLRKQGVDTGGAIADLTKQLKAIDSDLYRMERAHSDEIGKTVGRLSGEVTEAYEKLRASRNRLDAIDGEINRKKSSVSALENDLDRYRSQWGGIEAERFQDTTAEACAACGLSLPAGRVQEARNKALKLFNDTKANRLAEITRKGVQLSDERDGLQSQIAALETEKQGLTVTIPEAEKRHQELTAERDAVKKQAEDYSAIPGRAALLAQKTDIEQKITAAKGSVAQDTAKIEQEIDGMETTLKGVKEKHGRFETREKAEKRIEELKAEEKKLASEFEQLESELFLCEQFIRTKVSMLTDRINSRFEIVRFKLFNVQVNGGLDECCEITVNGVPYNGGLNNAARINSGLDICRTLSQHYGLLAPVFVDNAESVTSLVKMDAQVIRLVVSALDKTLRVEMANRKMVAA
ncbi:MAG: hypothetical protein C4586_08615 [Anaerolineaceae bacterium]|nr:MAG: hypothetical protein C4586_08615 [Anaerolineaceae bacterium]